MTFNSNRARLSGGAIYSDKSHVDISESNFVLNEAIQKDGGAIVFNCD